MADPNRLSHNISPFCTTKKTVVQIFPLPLGGGGLGPQLPSLATPMLYIYILWTF